MKCPRHCQGLVQECRINSAAGVGYGALFGGSLPAQFEACRVPAGLHVFQSNEALAYGRAD